MQRRIIILFWFSFIVSMKENQADNNLVLKTKRVRFSEVICIISDVISQNDNRLKFNKKKKNLSVEERERKQRAILQEYLEEKELRENSNDLF